ncbi:MAG: hypothetical protein ACUVYA_12670 [Planctomycetota bacterium]
MAISVSRSKKKSPPTTIPCDEREPQPVAPPVLAWEEERKELPPPPGAALREPPPLESEEPPEEAVETPLDEVAAAERELELSFDPEALLDLGKDELRALGDEVRAELWSPIESSPGYDPATAVRLLRDIREKVVPGPEEEDFLNNILAPLESHAKTCREGRKPTRRFRQIILTDFIGGAGQEYPPEQVHVEIELWGKILRALGCELSEEEKVAVGKAIRRVRMLRYALARVILRVRDPPERLGELGPNAIGTRRFILLGDLEDWEAARLWPEFQKALAENLSPSNLERATRLFRAFGVWTED